MGRLTQQLVRNEWPTVVIVPPNSFKGPHRFLILQKHMNGQRLYSTFSQFKQI